MKKDRCICLAGVECKTLSSLAPHGTVQYSLVLSSTAYYCVAQPSIPYHYVAQPRQAWCRCSPPDLFVRSFVCLLVRSWGRTHMVLTPSPPRHSGAGGCYRPWWGISQDPSFFRPERACSEDRMSHLFGGCRKSKTNIIVIAWHRPVQPRSESCSLLLRCTA